MAAPSPLVSSHKIQFKKSGRWLRGYNFAYLFAMSGLIIMAATFIIQIQPHVGGIFQAKYKPRIMTLKPVDIAPIDEEDFNFRSNIEMNQIGGIKSVETKNNNEFRTITINQESSQFLNMDEKKKYVVDFPGEEENLIPELTELPHKHFKYDNSLDVPKILRGREFYSDDYVTLITQFTPERAKMFKMICDAWEGSVSAMVGIIYAPDGTPEWSVDAFLKKFPGRTNIKIQAYNITGLPMVQYPINELRNIAWDASTTPFVFLLDVDFVPSLVTHRHLMRTPLLRRYIEHPDEKLPTENISVIVPAFEAKKPISSINDKTHSLELLRRQSINIWGGKHHQASNYGRWMTANNAYCTEPDVVDEYEPYVVVPYYAPKYDERFLGYSKNKKSQILELILAGYSFVISHNTIITHMPHKRSMAYQRSGRDDNAQNWDDFNRERRIMYPDQIARCEKIDWQGLIDPVYVDYPRAPPKNVTVDIVSSTTTTTATTETETTITEKPKQPEKKPYNQADLEAKLEKYSLKPTKFNKKKQGQESDQTRIGVKMTQEEAENIIVVQEEIQEIKKAALEEDDEDATYDEYEEDPPEQPKTNLINQQ